MSRVLISGSISYDTLLHANTDFRDSMGNNNGALSVGFHCQTRHRAFGGCAANMSFHLSRLGIDARPIAAVGTDFAQYGAWMDENGIDQTLLHHVDSEVTAQVFIISDAAENQILALYLGAMNHSKHIRIADSKADLAVVGPDDRDALLQRIEDFERNDTPILFDPGQCITSLLKDDLQRAVSASRWLIVNEFESSQIETILNTTIPQVAKRLDAVFVTQGSRGSLVYADGDVIQIDASSVIDAKDPTGCGDAYRAGLIAGLLGDSTFVDAATTGSTLAAETLQHIGAQWKTIPES